MSDYRKSDYAINRNRTGIIYRFAKSIVEIDLHDFLQSSPELTEQDFRYWKQISDEMYLEEKRANWRESNRNICLQCTLKDAALMVQSAEESYIQGLEEDRINARRNKQLFFAKQAINSLSTIQRRRYILHVVHQLSYREIARIEGVSPQSVHRSVQEAKVKIRTTLEKQNKNNETG